MTEQSLKDTMSLDVARDLDSVDELKALRDEFIIPSKSDLRRQKLTASDHSEDSTPSIYMCGNSLGLQPKRTKQYINSYLSTWSTKGVYGHFNPLDDALTVPWMDIGDQAAESMCKIVGAASSHEVAVMQTLTANLHFLMASFYRPDRQTRWKIIMESKAFPSDHYAIFSQAIHHGLDPTEAVVMISPDEPEDHYLSTNHILQVIDEHASETALLLLPGVHFYSGQYFDISRITSHAQAKGIAVGWDLAHAVGNVPLKLHDWNVDFAAWCSYKYLCAGPGSIAGLFVHERHAPFTTSKDSAGVSALKTRFSGWWGSDVTSRFQMSNQFQPLPGAKGWQLSNPSVFDCTSLIASLSVFNMTSMEALRRKSIKLTGFLEQLLDEAPVLEGHRKSFRKITTTDVNQRGAQLSLKLESGLLNCVMKSLEDQSVVVDERKPDVIRVAPAPLYNTFEDVWLFVQAFAKALQISLEAKWTNAGTSNGSTMIEQPTQARGWSQVT